MRARAQHIRLLAPKPAYKVQKCSGGGCGDSYCAGSIVEHGSAPRYSQGYFICVNTQEVLSMAFHWFSGVYLGLSYISADLENLDMQLRHDDMRLSHPSSWPVALHVRHVISQVTISSHAC